MKTFIEKYWLWVLFYIFIFFLLLFNSFRYVDSDLGWHLKVGQDILKYKEIPHLNYFNYTTYNIRWVDHEWLSDLISYWMFDKVGYIFLSIFFVFILLVAIILLNWLVWQRTKNFFLIIIFEIFGIVAILPHTGVRMQEITILFTVLLLLIINLFEKKKKWSVLFSLPVLFYFWACLHGGFPIGLGILFLYILAEVVVYFKNKYLEKKVNFSFAKISVLIFFSLLAFLATLITPYKLELYSFLFDYRHTFYMGWISEWMPQYYYPFHYRQLAYLIIIGTLIFLVSYNFFIGRNKKQEINSPVSLFEFFLIIFFTLMAIKSKRHFPLLFVVSFCPLVFSTQFFLNIKNSWNFKFEKKLLDYIIIGYLTAIFSVVGLLLLISTEFNRDPFNYYCKEYPCRAVEFIKNDSKYANLNLFSDYGWGGYLIWTWPEKKLFIDGRLSQAEYKGHSLLEEYVMFYNKDEMENKLRQYEIDLVLIQKDKESKLNFLDKFFMNQKKDVLIIKNNLYSYLKNNQNWKIVYEDELSIVFVKQNL